MTTELERTVEDELKKRNLISFSYGYSPNHAYVVKKIKLRFFKTSPILVDWSLVVDLTTTGDNKPVVHENLDLGWAVGAEDEKKREDIPFANQLYTDTLEPISTALRSRRIVVTKHY